MPEIRAMQKDDLHQANMIIARAFSQARSDCGYSHTHVPMCRREFISFYYSHSPRGCFIAEDAGQIKGVIFSHIWGKTGWIGPLAVAPEKHLMGMGKLLMKKTTDYLIHSGCGTIGLETNPRNSRNLGFYGHLGFVPSVLSIDMIKPVSVVTTEDKILPHKTVYYSRLSDKDKHEFKTRVWDLTQLATPNLDYTPLIDTIDASRYGETVLFIRRGTAIGFAVLQTEPTNNEEQNLLLRIFAMAAHPKTPDSYFRYFLMDLMKFAKRRAFERVVVRVPGYSGRAFQIFLQEGYRVYNSDLRMTLEHYPEIQDGDVVHLNRWV